MIAADKPMAKYGGEDRMMTGGFSTAIIGRSVVCDAPDPSTRVTVVPANAELSPKTQVIVTAPVPPVVKAEKVRGIAGATAIRFTVARIARAGAMETWISARACCCSRSVTVHRAVFDPASE